MAANADVVAELAPTGVLRAGVNLSNFLLVSGRNAAGEPEGISPDLARAIADRLGVPIRYVSYPHPSALAEAAEMDVWDIGLIGAEPARAEKIAFTAAYAEIEATYIVRVGSPFLTVADVDASGVRIVVAAGSAYDLWLERRITRAKLVRASSLEASFQTFVDDGLEALAGLRPRLMADVERLLGLRLLDDSFTSVQQAVGTARANVAGATFLRDFIEEAKRSGLIAEFIERHGIRGLSVAGPAR